MQVIKLEEISINGSAVPLRTPLIVEQGGALTLELRTSRGSQVHRFEYEELLRMNAARVEELDK